MSAQPTPIRRDDPSAIAEASAAFGTEATMEGLALRLWKIGPEIHSLNRERENLRTILKEHIVKTGEVIPVTSGKYFTTLRLEVTGFSNGKPQYAPRFDKAGVR